jgi:hypothetical protein
VRRTRTRETAGRALTEEVRALVLPVHPRIRQDIVELHERAWNLGAIILVLLPVDSESNERAAINDVILSAVDPCSTLNLREGRLEVLPMADADEIAEVCARHRAGRRWTRSGFRFAPGIQNSHKFLLRRAFHGYPQAIFTALGGGFSDACVHRVEARDAGGNTTPFLAKIGPHEPIQTEIETTRDFVSDKIPFPNHAPIIHDRCVIGATERLVAERLVDRATRFDDFLGTAIESDALLCLDLTFRGALRIWREGSLRQQRRLAQDYQQTLKKRVIGEPRSLVTAAQGARQIDSSVLDPDELLRLANTWPTLDVGLCLGHGDLQLRNVFARWFTTGGERRLLDVVLIDFESAGETFARSRDYSTLEVSFALDEMLGAAPLATSALDELFSFDSLLCDVRPSERRGLLIRRLRELASEEGISREEYAMSLAAYFLRYARFTKTQPIDRCVAAYRSASRIVRALGDHFR